MYYEPTDHACIHLSKSATGAAKPDFALLTPAGETYNELTGWLVGARMISKTIEESADGGQRWVIRIEREKGYQGAIVWDTQGKSHFDVPADWNLQQVHRLDGEPPAPIQGNRRVSIGPLPILIDDEEPSPFGAK